jgi:hypothetical protein
VSDIQEILKKNRLLRINRSERFTENQEQDVSNKASHVKRFLGGEDSGNANPVALTVVKDTYYNMLGTYKGKFVSHSVDMNKKSLALWTRVENCRAQADCDAERYLKAQFAWFDKAFGKAPTVEQLATETAIDRALEFTGSTKGRVLGNERKAPVTKADMFRESEKTLQKMMAAQGCNREEFYRKFVLTGIFGFPDDFLRADPTFQRVKAE